MPRDRTAGAQNDQTTRNLVGMEIAMEVANDCVEHVKDMAESKTGMVGEESAENTGTQDQKPVPDSPDHALEDRHENTEILRKCTRTIEEKSQGPSGVQPEDQTVDAWKALENDEEGKQLSEDDKAKLQLLENLLLTGKVTLDVNQSGNLEINYKKKSRASTDTSTDDTQRALERFLNICSSIKEKLIRGVEEEIQPKPTDMNIVLFVNFDASLITLNNGLYREGNEYVKLKVLGKGISGEVSLIEDKTTLKKHALKKVHACTFRPEELQSWVDFSDLFFAPALHLCRVSGNLVLFHMEALINAVSLQTVLDVKLRQINEQDSNLLRPFSFFVFHGMLKAAQTMHVKKWAHADMHGNNVLLQMGNADQLVVKLIDFGCAQRIKDPSGTLRSDGVKSDILNIVRNFTALYPGEGFNDCTDLEKNRVEKLTEWTKELGWSEEKVKELLDLVEMAMAVVDPKSKHFHQPGPLIHKLEEKMDEGYFEAMKTVAGILLSTGSFRP